MRRKAVDTVCIVVVDGADANDDEVDDNVVVLNVLYHHHDDPSRRRSRHHDHVDDPLKLFIYLSYFNFFNLITSAILIAISKITTPNLIIYKFYFIFNVS